MPTNIKDKALQDRFLQAVKGLSLRFEVADIAKATGMGEPTVSTYLNSGRQVSRPFLRKFCEVYGIDYDLISSGRKGKAQGNADHFSPDQLYAMFMSVSDKQTDILKSIESKMAQQDSQARIEKKIEEADANLRLVLETLRTVAVRQEADEEIILHSLARIERKPEKELFLDAGRRKGQIEKVANKHGNKPA